MLSLTVQAGPARLHRAALACSILLLIVALVFAFSDAAWPDCATVLVASQPGHAKVFVNGYFKGFTPCSVSICSAQAKPREYRFTIIKPGYEKWNEQVSLTAGAAEAITAELEKLPDPIAGRTICIDPGHPSETSPGTKGPSGVTENHINWVIALKLKQTLIDRGAKIVLTKPAENQKVTNRRRAEIANENNSAIMIRLHCDAAAHDGFSLYYPDRQGTRYGVTGPAQSVITASKAAAPLVYQEMKSVLRGHLTPRGVHGASATYIGSKQGALTGSIFSQVPVLTIEMCTLTIASDEQFIKSENGQKLMVQALAQGLANFLTEDGR